MISIHIDTRKKKRWLKEHGYADASIKESLSVRLDKNKGKEQRRQLAKKVADTMFHDNVIHALPSFLKTFSVKKGER